MATGTFKVGDRVQLKTGGPVLTVNKLDTNPNGTGVECLLVTAEALQAAWIDVSLLEIYKDSFTAY